MTVDAATVLVTGGAGYIGSHTCRALRAAGFRPVVYDDLSNGHAEFVRWGPLERGDVRDRHRLAAAFARHAPVATVHFAGLIEVGHSVRDPLAHLDANVAGSLAVIAAARAAGCDRFVFSSTCAVYGAPLHLPLDEDHPREPINPYGRSKLMVEQVLEALEVAGTMRSARLRYFNAAGAAVADDLGEWHEPESHVVPLAIEAALGRRDDFALFGTDYDTPDGSCVRDFVHVDDLADAHVRAVRHLLEGGEGGAFNLGTGCGTSVRELCECVGRHVGRSVPLRGAGRRAGDPPVLTARPDRAHEVLGWRAIRDLDATVASAVAWHTGETRAKRAAVSKRAGAPKRAAA